MTTVGYLLGLLAVLILGFSLTLMVTRQIVKRRLDNVVGPFLVRLGPPKGRGRQGQNLPDRFDTLEAAQEAATAALLGHPNDDDVAYILGRREDDQWDVVDRVDVLTK